MNDVNTGVLKTRVIELVNEHAKLAQVINDSLFSFGELGFHEVETAKFLTATLERHGFKVERGVAGMPTGWVARWGSGGPVIALGSDTDALPNVSQKPGVAYHEPLVEGGPGHGEGHNSGQAVNIAAALALKELMQNEGLPGTLMLWPGIAEELLAGKAFQVRDGMFDGVDAVLFTHVGANLETGWGEVRGAGGLISVEYAFHGASAHAAAAPWRGRSALDAVELMNMGWNVRREHLRPEQRSHYIITYGGEQPNVVPALAKVWYYIRETDVENVRKNFGICNRIADGAAMMTDTEVTRRMLGASWPRHYNRVLAETLQSNIEQIGVPTWTEEDENFARAVQRAAGGEEVGLAKAGREDLHQPVQPRHRRYRRRVVGGADGAASLSGQHGEPARPSLVQCHGDGDADCAQGHRVRRQGGGGHGARPAVAAGPDQRDKALLHRSADQGQAVRAIHRPGRQATDRSQRGGDGQVPPADAAVLL